MNASATMLQPALTPAPALPSPRLLGHLADFRRDLLGVFLKAWRNTGDIARIRVAHKHIYLLSHPRHAQHILVENVENYTKGTRGQELLRKLLGQGLLTSEGDAWRQRRRTANPAFRQKMIAGFAGTMAQAAADLAEEWAAADGDIDVAEAMNQLTLRIAGECFFSQDISGESSAIGAALTTVLSEFTRIISAPFPGWENLPTPRNLTYNRAVRQLDRAAREIVAARRASGEEKGDLLGMLLAARDPETGEGLSDDDLRDEVLTMLLAGHETTASTLAWTLHLLSLHPEAARRVAAEVETVVGDGTPTPEQARNLAFTGRVIQESMRLYPPAWILSRRATADDVIDGHPIPAGSFVFVCPYILHRHPDFWENPEGFDPDRFERSPKHQQAFLPFGAGQRKCIGTHFAELEARIVLAVLAQKLSLSLSPGTTVRPYASVTLRPEGALWMRASRR